MAVGGLEYAIAQLTTTSDEPTLSEQNTPQTIIESKPRPQQVFNGLWSV